MKKKKIIIIIIVILLIISILGTVFYIKNKNDKKRLKEEIEEMERIDREEQKEFEEEKKKEKEQVVEEKKEECSNTINATFKGDYNGGSFKEETTIVLKEDGSYEKSITEGEYQKGTYSISDGSILFEYIPSGAPPSAKSTYSYKISDDCSKITISNSNFSYTVNRK